MKLLNIALISDETANIDVECNLTEIRGQTYALVKPKSGEGISFVDADNRIRSLVDGISAHNLTFDKLAIKGNDGWVEAVWQGKKFGGFKRIRGAVAHCSSIEIPYLMLATENNEKTNVTTSGQAG